MLFVSDGPGTADPAAGPQIDGIYAAGPPTVAGRPETPVGREIALAVDASNAPLPGALVEMHSLTLAGVRAIPGADGVAFRPRICEMRVVLPALRQLEGMTRPLLARLSSELLQALPGAPPDVLLDLKESVLVTAGAGALAAPSFTAQRLSRTFGPITSQLAPTPKQLFDESAKLLGAVPLRDVVAEVLDQKPPELTWGGTPPSATFHWSAPLQQAGPLSPRRDARIDVTATAAVDERGRPVHTATGVINDFTIELLPGEPLVELSFSRLCFETHTGRRPTIEFDLDNALLLGKLAFVRDLQDLISAGGAGPRVDVSAKEITATYRATAPQLAVGALTIQNLVVDTGLTVPLDGRPVLVRFAFGTREKPFLVTVSLFGGGGYLELCVSAGGMERFVGAWSSARASPWTSSWRGARCTSWAASCSRGRAARSR